MPMPNVIELYNVRITFENRDPWESNLRFSDPPTLADLRDVIEEFAGEYSKELQRTAWNQYPVIGIEVRKSTYMRTKSSLVPIPEQEDEEEE